MYKRKFFIRLNRINIMQSKTGEILLLISAILTFIAGLGYTIFSFVTSGAGFLNPLLVLALVLITLFAGAKFYVSRMMRDPMKTRRAGVHAIIIGIIGGFDPLAIIGGIIAIVQGGKNQQQMENTSAPQTIIPSQ